LLTFLVSKFKVLNYVGVYNYIQLNLLLQHLSLIISLATIGEVEFLSLSCFHNLTVDGPILLLNAAGILFAYPFLHLNSMH